MQSEIWSGAQAEDTSNRNDLMRRIGFPVTGLVAARTPQQMATLQLRKLG